MNRRLEFAPVALIACAPAWVLILFAWLEWSPLGAALATFVLTPWVFVPVWMWLVERRGGG